MTASGRSGTEIGTENVEKLRRYLAGIAALPARAGKLHVQAVALGSGVDRQVLYKNPTCREMLEQAVATKGLRGIEERAAQPIDEGRTRLERRVSDLERTNAALLAENADLRTRLRRYAAIEAHLTSTGRMVR